MRTYSVVLDPGEESGYTVTVPALSGCITEGETVAECLANAGEAIELYIDGLESAGLPVPDERERPLVLQVTVAA